MRIKQPINPHIKNALGISLIVALLAGYSLISYQQHVRQPNDTTLPSLVQVSKALVKVCTPQGTYKKEIWLWEDFKATFGRLFLGLAIGCVIACVLGILMGCFESIEAFFSPTFNLLSKPPATALLPIFFVLLGVNEKLFVAMIVFGVVPTLTIAIFLSARDDVHEEQVNKAYTLGATTPEVVYNIVTMQILPKIMDAVRLQLGPAMVYLIAAEYANAQVGFGYRLRIQERLLQMDVAYIYVILLGLAGFLMSWGIKQCQRYLCPWYDKL